MKPRPDQEEVCKYRGGYMAVPAIPGAGKTFTLAVLATRLIKEEKHKPGKILIVTYMNSAVANFKNRIASMLEKEGLPKNKGYEVMTLHSLAMKIIKEKPENVLVSHEFDILDDIAKERLLHKLVNNWVSANLSRFHSFIDFREGESSRQREKKINDWLKKFTRVVDEMIPYIKTKRCSSEELLLYTQKDTSSLLRCVAEIFFRYELELKRQGLLDFTDIICYAIDILKNDETIRQKFQKRYSYVFEDEAQDSSNLQEEMLFLISDDNKNLVRVGDSNQSIMSSFTISDPMLFKHFYSRKDVIKKKIESSSRSTKDIIDVANFLVEWAQELHPTLECRQSLENQKIKVVDSDDPFPNPTTNGYMIGLKVYETKEEEVREVAKRAAKYAQENPQKTIAILVPNNYTIEDFKIELDKLDVKYREISNFPSERTRATSIIGSVLNFIAAPFDNNLFFEVLKTCFIPDLEEGAFPALRKFIKTCRIELLLYPISGYINTQEIPKEIFQEINWDTFLDYINTLKLFLEASDIPLESLIIFIANVLGFDEDQMAIAQKISSDIRYMLLLNPDWGIKEIARELKTIKNTLNYFANIVYDRKGFEPEPGEINLLTYHKSKGLEFDTVYLTCITSSEFPATLEDKFLSDYWCLKPNYRNPVSIMKVEIDKLKGGQEVDDPGRKAKIEVIGERLRLLYVGITRAKENLLLTSHKAFFNKDLGKVSKTSPSLYLYELAKFTSERRKAYAK